ncbi:MAG: Hsp20/alpha crystallin family protein [Candidatus Lokiarchaeota archaeon]|nr:Hsp20/alpha crystallin family protein [Candidatus Lokiarchaeota archaeon]
MRKENVEKHEKDDLSIHKEAITPTVFRPFEWMTELDRWFSGFRSSFDDFFYKPYRLIDMPTTRIPAMDISEDDNKYEITAEMPGLNKEDIDINLKKDMVEIIAKHTEEKEEEEKNYIRKERGKTVFYRKIPLPDNVNRNSIEATLKNGVMHLVLPKKEPTVEESTKIDIK